MNRGVGGPWVLRVVWGFSSGDVTQETRQSFGAGREAQQTRSQAQTCFQRSHVGFFQ